MKKFNAKTDGIANKPAYLVIHRAVHFRGRVQQQAIDELLIRGLWLSEDQKIQAGFQQSTGKKP